MKINNLGMSVSENSLQKSLKLVAAENSASNLYVKFFVKSVVESQISKACNKSKLRDKGQLLHAVIEEII